MGERKYMVGGISRKTLERLPVYHRYLERKLGEGMETIASPAIASELQLSEVSRFLINMPRRCAAAWWTEGGFCTGSFDCAGSCAGSE